MKALRPVAPFALAVLLQIAPAATDAQETIAPRTLQVEDRLIVFAPPPPRVTETVDMPRGGVLSIMDGAAVLELRGESLQISFPGGGIVLVEGWPARANHVRLPSGAMLAADAVLDALRLGPEALDIARLEASVEVDRPSGDVIVSTRAPLAGRADWLVAREILEPGETEPVGFRAYGYLLFADNLPDGKDYERRLAAIRAYVHQFKQVHRHTPNKTALFASFVDDTWRRREYDPDAPETVIAALMHAYDFERARVLQRRLGLPTFGPMIISGSEPLLGNDKITRNDVMVMDLSWIEPKLVDEWLREYRRVAEGEYEWDSGSLRQFALELLARLNKLGQDLHMTREAIASIVKVPTG